jgi:SPP1 family predicted phage head-tail adaptor
MSKFDGIGSMNRRITIQKKVIGSDASNQRKITGWENIDRSPVVWAHIDERSGSEAFQAEQLVGLTSAIITIRYRTDLSIENKVVFNGKNYDIQAIIDRNNDRKFLQLTCESGGQYK